MISDSSCLCDMKRWKSRCDFVFIKTDGNHTIYRYIEEGKMHTNRMINIWKEERERERWIWQSRWHQRIWIAHHYLESWRKSRAWFHWSLSEVAISTSCTRFGLFAKIIPTRKETKRCSSFVLLCSSKHWKNVCYANARRRIKVHYLSNEKAIQKKKRPKTR